MYIFLQHCIRLPNIATKTNETLVDVRTSQQLFYKKYKIVADDRNKRNIVYTHSCISRQFMKLSVDTTSVEIQGMGEDDIPLVSVLFPSLYVKTCYYKCKMCPSCLTHIRSCHFRKMHRTSVQLLYLDSG